MIYNLNNLLRFGPYTLKKNEKFKIFNNIILNLTKFHTKNCSLYYKIFKGLGINFKLLKNYKKLPFIPVRLFKEFDFKSVKDNKVFKILRSSGTTSNKTSKIFLDKENATNQSRVLTKIVSEVLGQKRLPMLIVDKNPELIDRKMFNASIAAIYGFSIFGKNHTYLIKKDKDEIDFKVLESFLEKYGKEKFLIFGFTYKIFNYLILKFNSSRKSLNLSNGVLLHGGGWKKMENFKIGNKQFKKQLYEKMNLKEIYNYYGLVEQTGSIFIESKKCGYFHTSNFSDLIIRDKDFNVMGFRKKGLIQLISLVPTSYPGHSILTEDIGEIIGEDDCKCGNLGKYFLVHGRTKQAEVRGCSDT